MDVVIPRNSTIPKRVTKTYYTTEDGQTEMDNDIFQGERALARDNHCIAHSLLTGITPAKSGEAKIRETFDIDANGILNVLANEEGNDSSKVHITVNTNKSRLSSDQVKKLHEEAEKFKAEDEMHIKRINCRNDLEQHLYDFKRFLEDDEKNMRFSEDDKKLIKEVVKRGLDWLEENPGAPLEQLKIAQDKADEKLSPVAAKYNLYSDRGGHHGGEDSD